MKRTLFCTLFLLCAVAAFSQQGVVLNSTAQPIEMMDHAGHAAPHAMGVENTLLETSVYSYAKGEVPLAELGSITYETPLGDIARAYRKEHSAMVTKPAKVLEK